MRADHLYIHVPFCARRCVYCDFSIAVRQRVPVQEYLTALTREWDARHAESVFTLQTLYFGGGTPSKLGGDGVTRLMEIARSRASLEDGAEVTLEANPEDVTSDSAQSWKAAGINRVSLGVQSLDDAILTWMHRTHRAADALKAVHVLRDAGLSNISIDMIFAAPSELVRSWRRELDLALEMGLPHVSIYGLTIEPHTPLGRWVAREDVIESPEEDFESEFLAAHSALAGAGFEHYEVSNYAQPGQHSRHNWAYWRRRPYGGIGPAAHEFDGSTRRWNTAPYADWVGRTSAGRSTVIGQELLTPEAEQSESTYLGLRTTAGVQINEEEVSDIQPWIGAGWANVDAGRLHLTPSGWLRLDALANHLTLLRSRSYI